MRISKFTAGLTLAFGALVVSASEGEVEYRQHTMEAVGGHMQAAVDILRQKVTHADHMSLHADALADLSEIIPSLFPEGSQGGDALEEIWQQPEDFAERLSAMREAAAGFSTAAGATDMAALGEAFQALGQACKGCHDDYRAE
jgi:cytochrome c556